MSEDRSKGTLAGLRVVDLSRVLGGPFCTQWLGDLGADVIKVEPPQGDETRAWGPPFDDDGTASYFIGVNRSKSGVSIDMRTTEGRGIVLKLLQDADVLIENFKTGTLEKWDLGYEAVLKETKQEEEIRAHRKGDELGLLYTGNYYEDWGDGVSGKSGVLLAHLQARFRSQKHQCKAALGHFVAAHLFQSQFVAVKVERVVQVRDPHHGV